MTSASLMVAGPASEEAVALARSHPRLAVGLHLVVAAGRPALSPSEIPHLVDSEGRFPSAPVWTGLRYQFSKAAREELRREIRAQLERFHQTGLTLSHVDGHLHMHLHPFVLETLVELSGEFHIRAVRLPFEEPGIALAFDRSHLATKLVWSGIFRLLRRHGERRLSRAGIAFAERVYGLLMTGGMTEEYLLHLIPRISAATAEIYCHPDACLPGEPRNGPAGAGPRELAAVLAASVRRAAAEHGFVLGSYGEASSAPSRPRPGNIARDAAEAARP